MEETFGYKDFPVLYIDDEECSLATFKEQFKSDFSVFTVSNLVDAEKLLGEHEIAVIVMDQNMPVHAGIDSLVKINEKGLYPWTTKILIADYASSELVIRAINDGKIYSYLSKPYNEEEVKAVLKQAIYRYFLEKDRERLYQEKISTMKKIARANKLSAVGTLSAGMAHEINNPLVSISTFLQMLPMKRSEEEVDMQFWNDYYSIVLKELQRIQNLISRLVRFSRGGEHDMLKLEEMDINECIIEMSSFVANEAKKKHISISMELSDELPTIKADKERIYQVLLNLLLNAMQSIKHRGDITISTDPVRRMGRVTGVEIIVQDTGSGISEENLQKLFTPFFTTKNLEGSGLGLMTCHQIVDDHRGTVDVKSKVEEGSTFRVMLPLNPASFDRRQERR